MEIITLTSSKNLTRCSIVKLVTHPIYDTLNSSIIYKYANLRNVLQMHVYMLPCFKQEYCYLPEIEVDEVLSLVSDIGAKVSAHYAVPCR